MIIQRSIFCILLLFANAVFALDLELTQGINSALPVGIDNFGPDGHGAELSKQIKQDLSLSGEFRIINRPSGSDVVWKSAGADSVVLGKVISIGNNRYEVKVTLVDVVAHNRLLLSKIFRVSAQELRPLAHHLSDLIYEKLTGVRGIFSTRIAYVVVQNLGDGLMRESLEVADMDGNNPQSLFSSSEPIMSPAWSPDGSKIAFVSFERKKAQIFVVSVETGQRRLITDFAGINGAPAWSIDGRQLAVVLSKSGSPKIYNVNLNNGQLNQLTFGNSIDTEPRFAPDGRTLLFTSNRGGSPQIYRLFIADGRIERVTYTGNYNARASYTADQKRVVMLHREDSNFNIAVQDGSTGRVDTVTFAALDESPSLSPNGKLILYATRANNKGILGIVSIDGRIHMQLPSRAGDVKEPAWSPFLN